MVEPHAFWPMNGRHLGKDVSTNSLDLALSRVTTGDGVLGDPRGSLNFSNNDFATVSLNEGANPVSSFTIYTHFFLTIPANQGFLQIENVQGDALKVRVGYSNGQFVLEMQFLGQDIFTKTTVKNTYNNTWSTLGVSYDRDSEHVHLIHANEMMLVDFVGPFPFPNSTKITFGKVANVGVFSGLMSCTSFYTKSYEELWPYLNESCPTEIFGVNLMVDQGKYK